ncbi:strictosidine synthase [Zea mays]|uniref:Male fertility protein n=1 Tax=Zea mays TaxID=4577 RepID=Q94KI9_MAIZE|nr:strictosidine synthase [Zea mays]AAK52489.1 male fertility protein [Zea mays]AQL07828.1 Protein STRICTOSIDINE SYNTHASE-LIKE 13 [Zea mays]|eukprot:NP_001311160.1 strictosidine synthase [Zea mays]
MEKRNLQWRRGRDGIVQYPHLFFAALALALLVADPFGLSPLAEVDYRPVKHELAPYGEVMGSWPRDNASRLRRGRLEFVGEVFGPESIEFDLQGRGPYAGLADGRVVRWMGEEAGWETFAVMNPDWSEEVCANGVNSTTRKQHEKEEFCGRPLGLRFHGETGELYVADAYYGLMVVGQSGGVASSVAREADGDPIRFANDLDVHRNGSVFFTDTSMRYSRKDHLNILLEGEGTGRLLRYDPETSGVHVVLKGLVFPNGVQISEDHQFLLFSETTNCRIMRYWLEGPRAGEVEVFANLPGFPDNVRSNGRGQFWVAIDCCRTPAQEVFAKRPWLRTLYFKFPLSLKVLTWKAARRMHTVLALLDGEGRVVEVLEDRGHEVMKLVSEVREVGRKLWIGTVAHNHIATIPYPLED